MTGGDRARQGAPGPRGASPWRTRTAVSAALVLLAPMVVAPGTAHAVTCHGGSGHGTTASPYQIETAAQLDASRTCGPDAHFLQTADIDLGAYILDGAGGFDTAKDGVDDGGWIPLPELTGSYDGGGYSIDGLTIDRTVTAAADDSQGLFAEFDGLGVTGVNMTDVDITITAQRDADVGGLVAVSASGIINSSVEGEINIETVGQRRVRAGLMAAFLDRADELTDASASGTLVVEGTLAPNSRFGGLAAEVLDTAMTGAVSDVDIAISATGQTADLQNVSVGGLIGVERSVTQDITDASSSGDITIVYETTGSVGVLAAGGLLGTVGMDTTLTLKGTSSSSMQIDLTAGDQGLFDGRAVAVIGGLIGDQGVGGFGSLQLDSPEASGDISASISGSRSFANVGGVIGSASTADIDAAYYAGGIDVSMTSTIRDTGAAIGGLVGRATVNSTVSGGTAAGRINAVMTGAARWDALGTTRPAVSGQIGGILGEGGDVVGSTSSGEIDVDVTAQTGEVEVSAGGLAGTGAAIESAGLGDLRVTLGSDDGSDVIGYVGGLLGDGSAVGSRSAGDVATTVNGDAELRVGGLTGDQSGTVEDSYASGAIDVDVTGEGSGRVEVGGISGRATADLTRAVYVGGPITVQTEDVPDVDLGGLTGAIAGPPSFTDAFWDTETSGLDVGVGDTDPDPDGVTGKPTAALQRFATFTDTATEGLDTPWPMVDGWAPSDPPTTVWGICPQVNDARPFLLWEHDSDPCDAPAPAPAPAPVPAPELPVLAPGTGSSEVAGQPRVVTVEPQDDRGLRLAGDGIEVEIRPEVEVERFAGVRDRRLEVRGSGFAAGTAISVLLGAAPFDLGEVLIEGDGAWSSTSLPVPAQVSACAHTLHLVGTLPGGQPTVVSVGLWVRDQQLHFADVTESSTHFFPIGCLADTGIVQGVADSHFGADGTLTRGQASSLIARGGGLDSAATAPFPDVAGSTHEHGIGAVAHEGMISGYADGTFRPDGAITRGQFAMMLAGLLDLEPRSAPFEDAGDTHGGAIGALYAVEVVSGFTDGRFRPDQPVTRPQAATMLHEAMQLLP